MGYEGAADAVYRFLRSIDQPRQALEKASVRFETAPGEQAQVDWAEVGSYLDGTYEKGANQSRLSFSPELLTKLT